MDRGDAGSADGLWSFASTVVNASRLDVTNTRFKVSAETESWGETGDAF